MKSAEERRDLLAEGALVLGQKWVQLWCDDLRREGRPVAGGWPGTLPEARARAAAYFGHEFARRRIPLLTADELGWVARATYDKAKREWLSMPMPKGER